MKQNILVVTDHTTHSSSNSLYELALAIHNDARSGDVWVCSKGLVENKDFFAGKPVGEVYACRVDDDFAFNPDTAALRRSSVKLSLDAISAILIRMPQP